MTQSDLFIELREAGKPISRLEGSVPRFLPVTPDKMDRMMAALDRDLPVKSTDGLDEVAVEYYRRDYKAWRALLQKKLADLGVELTYSQSHRRVEVVVSAPEGALVTATVDGPLQVMDAYEHETSFYEGEAMFQEPPEPPGWPVERQSWWGEEAEFGVGLYAPRGPYQLPQQIEWTAKEGEDREILVMVPAGAEDEVQGTLRVQVRSPEGRSVEQVIAVRLKAEWDKEHAWLADGFAEIGVDINKEG